MSNVTKAEPAPERTVHLRDGRASRCGAGSSLTSNVRRVTCRRCLTLPAKQLDLLPGGGGR